MPNLLVSINFLAPLLKFNHNKHDKHTYSILNYDLWVHLFQELECILYEDSFSAYKFKVHTLLDVA